MKLGNMLCKVVLLACAMTIGSQAWGARMPDSESEANSELIRAAEELGTKLAMGLIYNDVSETFFNSDGTFCKNTLNGEVAVAHRFCNFGIANPIYEPTRFSEYCGVDVDNMKKTMERYLSLIPYEDSSAKEYIKSFYRIREKIVMLIRARMLDLAHQIDSPEGCLDKFRTDIEGMGSMSDLPSNAYYQYVLRGLPWSCSKHSRKRP